MAKRELKSVNVDEPIVDAVEEVTTEVVEDKAEEPVKVNVCKGIVAKCSKLNIRKKPNVKADVVTIVDVGSELSIDLDKSNDEWFKVTVNSKEGYCMKKYVTIDQ